MANKKQKILFVDFYGILSNTRFWFSLQNPEHKYHRHLADIQDFLFVQNRPLLDEWMRGEYTSEDIHRLLEEKFEVNFDELFDVFVKDCEQIELSQNILDKLQTLSDEYLRIMVTDNMDSFDRFILPANKILQSSFHGINNSFYVKKLKSDKNGEWFLDIANKYDIKIEDCILIDDSLQNCETFQKLGGKYYNSQTEDDVLSALNNFIK